MPMELTDAEREMIELLRNDRHITLTIVQDGEHWHMRLEDHDVGNIGDGHGSNFGAAWDDVRDNRMHTASAPPPRLL